MKKLCITILLLLSGNNYGMFEEVQIFSKNLCKSSYTTAESALYHHSTIIAPVLGYAGGYLIGWAANADSDTAASNCAKVGFLLGINAPFARSAYQDYKDKTLNTAPSARAKWFGMVAGKALVFTTMVTASIGAYMKWCN